VKSPACQARIGQTHQNKWSRFESDQRLSFLQYSDSPLRQDRPEFARAFAGDLAETARKVELVAEPEDFDQGHHHLQRQPALFTRRVGQRSGRILQPAVSLLRRACPTAGPGWPCAISAPSAAHGTCWSSARATSKKSPSPAMVARFSPPVVLPGKSGRSNSPQAEHQEARIPGDSVRAPVAHSLRIGLRHPDVRIAIISLTPPLFEGRHHGVHRDRPVDQKSHPGDSFPGSLVERSNGDDLYGIGSSFGDMF
jgi:hypothetical protein